MALTLRLSGEETDKLEKIGSLLDVGTSSGAIRKLIDVYLPKMKELEEAYNKIAEQQKLLENIKREHLEIETAKKQIESSKTKISKYLDKVTIQSNTYF